MKSFTLFHAKVTFYEVGGRAWPGQEGVSTGAGLFLLPRDRYFSRQRSTRSRSYNVDLILTVSDIHRRKFGQNRLCEEGERAAPLLTVCLRFTRLDTCLLRFPEPKRKKMRGANLADMACVGHAPAMWVTVVLSASSHPCCPDCLIRVVHLFRGDLPL